MPHSSELIANILRLVEVDYPPDVYRYAIEQSIPGTKMFPDITVWNGHHIQCAVEIGYTRPEKLAAYREKHKIPDVRWYDKKGNLHADVEERVVKATVHISPTHEFSVYEIGEAVECHDPECVQSAEIYYGAENFEAHYDYLIDTVFTTLVTDWDHAWFPSFCDKCGSNWLADEHAAWALVADLFDCKPQEFGMKYGARLVAPRDWSSICERVLAVHNLSLEYRSGIPVATDAEFAAQREIMIVKDEAVQKATPRRGKLRKPVIRPHQLELNYA